MGRAGNFLITHFRTTVTAMHPTEKPEQLSIGPSEDGLAFVLDGQSLITAVKLANDRSILIREPAISIATPWRCSSRR
jgi:hypothetical protein